VLEQELCLTGQPRAIILHEKNGREHIHVVWQRTNVDTMTLVSDSNNYYAHEQASLALEEEFGHEHVPGKHAKHDRTKPPPNSEINDAEWQQAERTGADPRARKTAITGFYQQSDSGQAFRAALSGAGYVLAKGDRRDYVIVDGQGEVHSLARQIAGVTTKDLRAFMADIDQDSIPTVEQAKALQREIATSAKAAPTSKAEPSPPKSTPEPEWQPPGLAPEQLAKLANALKERQNEEDRRLHDRQEVERTRTAESIDRENAEKLGAFDSLQQATRNRYDREHIAERGVLHRILGAIMTWFNPAKAAEEQRQRAQARDDFQRRQRDERASQIARLNIAKECGLADLAERQEQQSRDRAARYVQELARLTRDHDAAQRLIADTEARHRQQEPAARQQPTQAVPAAAPLRGIETSRFLQPKPSSVLALEPDQPPRFQSRFIPATAERVALPSRDAAAVPVTASRFLQPPPRPVSTQEVAKPPIGSSRFIATTAEGVPVPARTTVPMTVTKSRFLTKSPEAPKSVPLHYPGINSKFLRPREATPQPKATPIDKPSQPPPKAPRSLR
jgi:hypothetical protein